MSSSTSPPPAKKAKKEENKRPVVTKGIMEYLRLALPRTSLLELYQDDSRGHYVCRAVLQRLPETSQQIVVRLSCCGGSFPQNLVNVWTKSQQPRKLEELYQWAILQSPKAEKGEISLTPEFYKGLRTSLHSLDVSPWNALTVEQMDLLVKVAEEKSGKPVQFPSMTTEDLERYTQDQWDAVLHYLVGTSNMKVSPNEAVTHFLLQTNLMQPDPDYRGKKDDAPLVITEKGYDFMLQDNAQQGTNQKESRNCCSWPFS